MTASSWPSEAIVEEEHVSRDRSAFLISSTRLAASTVIALIKSGVRCGHRKRIDVWRSTPVSVMGAGQYVHRMACPPPSVVVDDRLLLGAWTLQCLFVAATGICRDGA